MGPRPLGWREAMSEQVFARCSASDEFRRGFVRAVGELVYEAIHTDCDPGCVCREPRGLHNGRVASK